MNKKQTQNAIIIADLGFGDAGKGSMVDYFTRQFHRKSNPVTIIRYNGGAQAAHNVITPESQHHTFSQFGSGMFVPGTQTYLSRFMLIDPLAMLNEEEHLQGVGIYNALARTAIDRNAVIITPFHQAANRLKELARGENRHGSCGMGIGETAADFLQHGGNMLLAGDLAHPGIVMKKLHRIRDMKLEQLGKLPDNDHAAVFHDPEIFEACAEVYAYFAEQVNIVDNTYRQSLLKKPGTLIFEGAQGVLLDEWYGFFPYTTWSTTTFKNADTLLENYTGEISKLGVIRAYATRHGRGPFVTEDKTLTALLPDEHNINNTWQQTFRIGYFDAIIIRYALEIVGQIDGLAITCLDRLQKIPDWKICTGYNDGEQLISEIKVKRPPDLNHQARLTEWLQNCTPHYENMAKKDIMAYIARLEELLRVKITWISEGATAADKRQLKG